MSRMLTLYLPLLFAVADADFLREIIRKNKEERYGALQCADARFVNDECEGYLRDFDTGLGQTRKKPSKKPKFCLGNDGNKYKPGKGYVDQEACMTYKCVKTKKKLSMSEVPISSCGTTATFGPTGPIPTFKKNWFMTGKKIKTKKPIKSPTHINCWVKCQSNSKCNFIMWTKKKRICTFFSSNEGGKPKTGFISGPVATLSTPASSTVTSTPASTECPACPACPSISNLSSCPSPPTMPTCPPPAGGPSSSPVTTYSTTPSQSTANSSAIQGCSSEGQLINVSNIEASIITSPEYPHTNYSDNTFCDWTFQAPPGQKISFTLLELETEFGYDVLKLYDGAGGEEEKAPFLTTMSGTKIHDAVISSKEQMRVTFTTDLNNNMKGFKASVSAFNKEDMPQFDWLDEKNINVTFPNGKSEIIGLKLSPNVRRSCVFHGKTVNTSLTISSSNTNSGCRSLTEDVEISITSNYLEGNFGLFSLKNGKLTKTDETVFVSNSLNREVRHLSKRATGIKLPKQIQIPVNFGFDRGLLTKLGKYGLGQNFIERRIEEVFDHGKYSLQGISSDISIDLVFKSAIVFIDDTLHMNQQDLDKCRQFQVDEQTPLIILIDDDYANHVKGLSFRSGVCRSDTQRYGVTMVAWNDHSAFMGDVVYHEMGHMLGGIHDGGKSEHHSGLHLGHSEFNSQNVNEWFISAGYRCFGKTCTGPPSSPSHGTWTCDSSLTSCQLICSPGYTPIISHTDCINGQWDTTNSHVCALTSSNTLYLLAGGWGALSNVELYHPTLGSPSCKSPPPQLTEDIGSHTTFIHDSTIYICGGYIHTASTCISLTTGASAWTSHQLPSSVGFDLSSVVLGDTLFFIGGNSYSNRYATLPLSSSPTLTPVPNLSYRGDFQCVAQLSETTFVITGGRNSGTLSTVIMYNTEKQSETPLTSLSPPRRQHSCISLQEEDKMWLIVAGGQDGSNILATTQRLDITANTWENLGDLKQKRKDHSMINTQRGLMVLGGKYGSVSYLKSVELLVEKEWQNIEPSLATLRSHFGGTVQVPANFFNCQLDLKPGLGCPATNINTVDREDETVIENISTMEECSLECNNNLKCSYWTWFNEGQYRLNCALMSSYGNTLSDSTAVTAERKCDLGCPTPPARDNGAWTCNEANTACTLNCSPGYVSLHTEIKCSGGTWEDAESINCWEKKQPVEVAGCSGEYHYDEEYPGGEVVTVLEDTTCHGVCQERQDCVTWTWSNTTGCRLQTSLGTNQTKIGSISGTKNACKPVCYLVIEDEDEATTNTQYCPDPNQPTSCQNIIQMEASKYRETDEMLICYQKGDMLCESIKFKDVDLICNPEPRVTTLSVIQYSNAKLKYTRNLGPYFKKWGRPYGRK